MDAGGRQGCSCNTGPQNGEERLVVLNRVAKSVVESMRGVHPTHVFAMHQALTS
jgi:hypothetical protein